MSNKSGKSRQPLQSFQFFTIEYDVSFGLVIYGLYSKLCLLSNVSILHSLCSSFHTNIVSNIPATIIDMEREYSNK